MSGVYRTPQEAQEVAFTRLERIVSDLQRAAAGAPFLFAQSSGTLNPVPAAFTDVPGCSLAITRPGRYLFLAVFDFQWSVAGALNVTTAIGGFAVTGHSSFTTAQALMEGGARSRQTTPVIAAGTFAGSTGVVKLQASNNTHPTGNLICFIQHTCIAALRAGPV